MLVTLNAETLAALDEGRVAKAIEHALQQSLADCKDRPHVKKARLIDLSITVSPVQDEAGNLHSCKVQFSVDTKFPTRQTHVYDMIASRTGGLMFNELSPDEARQRTLDEEIAAKERLTRVS
jgi:hypothetical protein